MKEDMNDKNTIMQMYILALMMGKVGRYIGFQELEKHPLEEQYQIVKRIDTYIKKESKKK